MNDVARLEAGEKWSSHPHLDALAAVARSLREAIHDIVSHTTAVPDVYRPLVLELAEVSACVRKYWDRKPLVAFRPDPAKADEVRKLIEAL
jgi:hypothetical protein